MKLDSGSETHVTFTANVIKNTLAKRTAAFYQFWKTYNHRFYDSNFHGRDWVALRKKYLERLPSVDTNDEFAALLQMMVGELDSSHSELSPASSNISHRSTPHLGFTIDYSHKGLGLKVKYIPNRAPGSFEKTKLKSGEFVVAIDGKKVSGNEALFQFLTQKTTRLTTFAVNSKPTTDGARNVTYKLLSSSEWEKLRYEEKVQELRRRVEQGANGKIGYLRISAMGSKDQEKFEREAYEYIQGKDAMIFDVRFNNGGNISDTLIDWLERKPHGIYKSRDREPEVAPSRAWNKPVVVLLNEHSYSNGEMFPYAMRERGLAKLVGMPTPGYVIWTSTFTLTDGTKARIPGRGVFRMDGSNMENIGEKPDFQLWVTPDQWLKGEDPQLTKAIDLLREKPVNDSR
jgi:C-terminal processing protease CtpA/Prc